jgi:hypothetical protein
MVLSHVLVTVDEVLDWMIGFTTPYTFTTWDYRQYSAITDLQTLHFTVTHALGFSAFTCHNPGNGFITVSLSLQITHEVFFSRPNSFLAIILQLPILKTRLHSNPLLPSSYPGRLASRNSTLHFILLLFCSAEHFWWHTS